MTSNERKTQTREKRDPTTSCSSADISIEVWSATPNTYYRCHQQTKCQMWLTRRFMLQRRRALTGGSSLPVVTSTTTFTLPSEGSSLTGIGGKLSALQFSSVASRQTGGNDFNCKQIDSFFFKISKQTKKNLRKLEGRLRFLGSGWTRWTTLRLGQC